MIQKIICFIDWAYQNGVLEVISIIATLLVTIISIVVSVIALRKSSEIGEKQNEITERQNKIVLFEIRYSVVSALSFLLSTVKITISYAGGNKCVPLDSAMNTYLSTMAFSSKKNNRDDLSAFYTGIILESGKVEYLFKNEDTRVIMDFLLVVENYIKDIEFGEEYQEHEKKLKECIRIIEEIGLMKKLNEYLKLWEIS